ncbi:cytochrome P450 [Janthinobacterium psychrotolerans]|uniref:Cytochrome P450 n=1 Tax=Janthinobacterium psychrotolerans TaxID=1747903 RepID=A0A1A7C281_9BURK|nr:cytochrome P450 [Janthinobacterium psychrotolerans]OBV39124.1 Cytochrome P450 [Janthinobacterium psychrotolerans]
MFPHDPDHLLAAVTHAAPFDYYRRQADGPPLRFDAALDCWLATGAGVAAVLEHVDLRVRPAGQPVPAHLIGTACGALFAELARMNDGARHAAAKRKLMKQLAGVDLAGLHADTARLARDHLPGSAQQLNALIFDVPLLAVAQLLGFAPADGPRIAQWTQDVVAALPVTAERASVARAELAASALQAAFSGLRPDADASQTANLIGLLIQTCEATAALLGNSVLALRTCQGPTLAIHNTRRFAACDVQIDKVTIRQGQMVLVLLAGAGLAYGHGVHRCPGQAVAQTIVAAILPAWSEALRSLGLDWHYRPSPNARIPVFTTAGIA